MQFLSRFHLRTPVLVWTEPGAVECGKVADPLDLDVGRGIVGERFGIVCVVALPRKDCRNPIAPFRLHRRENPQLVVNEDVVRRGIEPLDVVELLLLVDEDQDPVLERAPNARPFDLARLKDSVAVRQDDRAAPLAEALYRVERPGIEPIGERIVDQPTRHLEDPRIVHILGTIAFERAKIVGVTEFPPQFLENRPVALPRSLAVACG